MCDTEIKPPEPAVFLCPVLKRYRFYQACNRLWSDLGVTLSSMTFCRDSTMKHPILEDLNWRTTVKHFDPSRRIPSDELAVLLEVFRLSPSSINSQPWRILVVQSDAARARLAKSMTGDYEYNYQREDYAEVVEAQIMDGRTDPSDREKAFGPFSYADNKTDASGSNEAWTRAQLYLALGSLMHACARLRIGSTPMEGIHEDVIHSEFSEELGGYHCNVVIALGYSDTEEDYNLEKPKSRLPLERICVSL